MKVLINIRSGLPQRYLVHLLTKAAIKEVRNLISNERYAQAMVAAFTKGKLERQVSEEELPGVEADLIISEHSASWDLIVKKS